MSNEVKRVERSQARSQEYLLLHKPFTFIKEKSHQATPVEQLVRTSGGPVRGEA